jgi:hypothetical protein
MQEAIGYVFHQFLPLAALFAYYQGKDAAWFFAGLWAIGEALKGVEYLWRWSKQPTKRDSAAH